ncbi:ferritin-like domain-containing protein [Pseudofulvibacter geojedonensis]|uniref:PA2169 family four-helix-bundle protein n=1 Tax=Pseudofulvibacter geojedonensis TaxID=1123758 RepID=A0ABW3I539_9FLAO
MNNYTEEVSDKLNGLLEKNYDAAQGYKTAAENVDNEILTKFFNRRQKEREKFGNQLKEEIKSYGQTPEMRGSVLGKTHRMWMNAKTFFTENNQQAILDEVLRGEKEAIKEYNEVINTKKNLPQSTLDMLTSHRDAILLDAVAVNNL